MVLGGGCARASAGLVGFLVPCAAFYVDVFVYGGGHYRGLLAVVKMEIFLRCLEELSGVLGRVVGLVEG